MKIKSFKQYINEMSVAGTTIPTEFDGVDYNYSRHFFDRLGERGNITIEQFKELLQKVRTKLKDLPMVGEFLFFSRKFKQGIITSWDAMKRKLSFITFLPPGKDFPKPGTKRVVVENINKTVTVIYID